MKIKHKFEQTKTMCVQTEGGSDVVVKNNPNMLTHEKQKCLERKNTPLTL